MSDAQFVYGAQVNLERLVREMEGLFHLEENLQNEITMALLDDTERPRLTSGANFRGNWKKPFVSAEVGEMLPHWQVGVYLNNPLKLSQAANTFRLTLALLITVLLLAIVIGSWLIAFDLQRQLRLSRQKTDFVSNVSHELKTPLTSIRMFAELLADGRVQDEKRRREYLGIINVETARLTRLINNVLDFARIERGEKTYRFSKCDLARLVDEVFESYRPQLEAHGFSLVCDIPARAIFVNGDRDALAQIMVNLLSNAEKYSADRKEINVRFAALGSNSPLPCPTIGDVILQVCDRGMGVPPGCEEKIFEQFYRAHDSLSSGIQGSGLGLTLARQIARAHGGDVNYHAREGGGSCFELRLPIMEPEGSSQQTTR